MQTFESNARLTARVIYDKVMRDAAAEKYTWPVEAVYGSPEMTKTYAHRVMKYSGLSLAHKRKAGRPIVTEDIVELGEITLTDEEIALGTNMDVRMLEDLEQISRKKYMADAMLSLRESFKHTVSGMAAYPLNEAFSSTNQTVWDSSAMITSRTLLSGDTYTNDLGTVPISFAISWDLKDKLEFGQRTQKGLIRKDKMVLHLVHDSQRRYMKRIWDQEYEKDTLTRNVNTLRGSGVKVAYCVELTDTGAQFAFTEEGRRNMVFKMRLAPAFSDEMLPKTVTLSVYGRQRVLLGALGFEGIAGGEGA